MDSNKYLTKIRMTIVKPKISRFNIVSLPILIVVFGVSALAQNYSDWSSPTNLGSPVNTPVLDGCPFISKDGLDLIFASNRAAGSGPTDLYAARRETPDGPWGDPVSLGADINTAGFEEFCPMLTISERYLYFVSNRPGGCGGSDIYVARRLDKKSLTEWGEPENLGCQVNSPQNDITPSLFEDEDGTDYLFFSSNRPGGMGGMDIYVSTFQADRTFGPASPVPGLNTASNDQRPNVRVRDGLEIFFDSNRSGSIAGSLDLYTSTRASTSSPWASPVNLGSIVNSSSIEGRASLSFDGTELYFMSNRPGAFGDHDIWVVRREKLAAIE
jgi:Tol biopolymer transport system component